MTNLLYDDLDRLTQVTDNLAPGEGGSRVMQTAYYADDRVQNGKLAVGAALVYIYRLHIHPERPAATMADAKNSFVTT